MARAAKYKPSRNVPWSGASRLPRIINKRNEVSGLDFALVVTRAFESAQDRLRKLQDILSSINFLPARYLLKSAKFPHKFLQVSLATKTTWSLLLYLLHACLISSWVYFSKCLPFWNPNDPRLQQSLQLEKLLKLSKLSLSPLSVCVRACVSYECKVFLPRPSIRRTLRTKCRVGTVG